MQIMASYKHLIFAGLTTFSAVALPGLAKAEPLDLSHMTMGYTYYNRPGYSLADHDADVMACATEAFKTQSFSAQVNRQLMTGIVPDMMSNAANRGSFGGSLENCMVVRGWRVVLLPDAEGKKLAKLEPAELARQLEPWVGAETPHGQVARVWDNDAANANVNRFAIRPKHKNDGLLSFQAATESPLAKMNIPALAPITAPTIDPKWPTRTILPEEIASAIPEAGVIIINIKGLSSKNGIGLSLTRVGPDKDTYPAALDHAPDRMNFLMGTLFAKKDANYMAIAVPPGRWRISSMGVTSVLNFCLGSPSFPIAAGETVFMGTFDFSATKLGPDLSLDGAKAWLAGKPAAETVRAAEYTNGTEGLCGDANIYALEVPGAPYKEGYNWGGAAKSRADTAQ